MTLASPPPPIMTAAEDIPLRVRVRAFVFLLLIYFCYAWAWNTVDVLRPYIASDLKLSMSQAGSMYSAQALGALIGALTMGQIADRFGRRNTLVVAAIGFGAALLSGAYLSNYVQLMGQRFVLGYFMGAMYPIVVGLYTIFFPPRVRGTLGAVALGVYNGAVAALGAAGAFALERDWRVLLYIGIVPIVLAPFALRLMPDDRYLHAHGKPTKVAPSRIPILELFAPAVRRQTMWLTLMCGLNFFAYQAFGGWATTLLRDERHLSGLVIGSVVAGTSIGSVIGGFFWGWLSDRAGRRSGAAGFLAAALVSLIYIFVPTPVPVLILLGGLYGAMLSASVVWGPWLTELFPPHLRSTAASIFHWGRIVSFVAPLITATFASVVGLQVSMSLASVSFVAAAAIWLSLPETLPRKAGTRG